MIGVSVYNLRFLSHKNILELLYFYILEANFHFISKFLIIHKLYICCLMYDKKLYLGNTHYGFSEFLFIYN